MILITNCDCESVISNDQIKAGNVIVGLASGWLIGKWTEYATSDEYQPTKNLAGQAVTGPATVIIGEYFSTAGFTDIHVYSNDC